MGERLEILEKRNQLLEAELEKEIAKNEEMHFFNAEVCDQLYWSNLEREEAIDRSRKWPVIAWIAIVICFFQSIVFLIRIFAY